MGFKISDSWINSYLIDAALWSRRSHDQQTQCGCVIAAKDMTPVSFGYNGFVRSIDDEKLPRTRPEKYPFMIHAEQNAIYNAVRQGKSTMDCLAFISAKPCIICLQALYQCGISGIYYTNISKPLMLSTMNKEYDMILDVLKNKIEISFIDKKVLDISILEKTMKGICGDGKFS